ncbi:MAG TPA: TadG family pilus assembly protein [Candidatus Binatia bacterium]|nr:TadG family pilus assembly protein [Candidatus Binatia bacterium]
MHGNGIADGEHCRTTPGSVSKLRNAETSDGPDRERCLAGVRQNACLRKASPDAGTQPKRAWLCDAKKLFTLRQKRERGGTSIGVAGTLAGSMAMAALVIDGGQIFVTHAELQTVADLAAESATRELARVYMDEGREDFLTNSLTPAEKVRIAAAADARARQNSAGGVSIGVDSQDVQIGRWDNKTGQFIETNEKVDAVQVRARRDDGSNGQVPALFAGVIGRAGFPVRAGAAARISGVSYLPPGTADFPVAIAKAWYAGKQSPCSTDNTITFYPTDSPEGCAGWHTFNEDPANSAKLRSILTGLRKGTFVSPEIDVQNTQFIFSGGTITSAINELKDLYDAKKDGNSEMRVLIPVYDSDNCNNPNGWIRIIGVARAVITKVIVAPEKRIEARVQCDVVEMGESGGPDFGVLAAGPDLVR